MRLLLIAVVGPLMLGGSPCSASAATQPLRPTDAATLKGTVKAILLPNSGQTFILLAVPASTGATEEWLIEGDSLSALTGAGWRPRLGTPLKTGDAITIVVYAIGAASATVRIPEDDPRILDIAKTARIARATCCGPLPITCRR